MFRMETPVITFAELDAQAERTSELLKLYLKWLQDNESRMSQEERDPALKLRPTRENVSTGW